VAALPKAFWPLTITAGVNDRIDFKIGASALNAVVPAGIYYTVLDLLNALYTAMQAATTAGGFPTHANWTYGVLATGRVRIGNSSGLAVTYTLAFSTGAGAAVSLRNVLGYGAVDAAFTSPGVAYVDSTNQHQNGWYGDRSIGFDGKAWFKRTSAQGVALAGTVKSLTFGEQELRTIAFTNLPAAKTKVEREGSSLNEALERLWRDGFARFRWWPDATVDGTYVDYCLDGEALKEFNPQRLQSKELYSLRWDLRRFV